MWAGACLVAAASLTTTAGCGEKVEGPGDSPAYVQFVKPEITGYIREVNWIGNRWALAVWGELVGDDRHRLWLGPAVYGPFEHLSPALEGRCQDIWTRTSGGGYAEDFPASDGAGGLLYVESCDLWLTTGEPRRRLVRAGEPHGPVQSVITAETLHEIDPGNSFDTLLYGLPITADSLLLTPDGKSLFEFNLHDGTMTTRQPPEPLERIWSVALSPNGEQYAVWATGDAEPREEFRGELWLLDRDLQRGSPLRGGWSFGLGVSWAPDGSSLLVAAVRDGQEGLWLVDVPSGRQTLLVEGVYQISKDAWSADGTKVVAVHLISWDVPSGDTPEEEVAIIDVAAAMRD